MKPTLRFLALGIAAVLLQNCGSNVSPLVITSDVPDLARAVEMYQNQNPGALIELRYKSPIATPDGAANDGDLLIGTGLTSQPVLNGLTDLDISPDTGSDDAWSDYYNFSKLKYKGATKVIMLSFDLPAIVSTIPPQSQDFKESILMPLQSLEEKSSSANRFKKNKLTNIGFSSFVNVAFIYMIMQGSGAEFTGSESGFPVWNENGIREGIKLVTSWSDRSGIGVKQEIEFVKKEIYDPPIQLVRSGTLQYAFAWTSELFKHRENRDEGLSIFWPSIKDQILVRDEFVGAAVPRGSRHPNEAKQFLAWLLKEETQKKYIEDCSREGVGGFGFLGGFSSNRYITEKVIPLYTKALRLRIPPEESLKAPGIVGLYWSDYTEKILYPWILDAFENGSNNAASLSEASNQWFLHLGLKP